MAVVARFRRGGPSGLMVLCPTGSSVNPSAGAYAWVTWLDAQGWLGAVWSKFSWLTYLIPPTLVATADFCATEPVQPVYPGDATVAAAAFDPVAFEAILKFLKESALWWSWHNLCQCNAGGVPACVTQSWNHASVPTSGGPVTNSAYYWQGHLTVGTETLWGADVYSPVSQTIELLYVDVPSTIFGNWVGAVVPGWNRIYFTTPLPMISGQTYRVATRATTNALNHYYGVTAGHTHTASSPVVLDGWGSATWNFSPASISANDVAIDPVICISSPVPYTPAPPPVPTTSLPDVPLPTCTTVGDLCGVVGPTVFDISLLKQRLDLLQRRLLPFAWIPGTPLTGLTGHGTVAVQDALGCIVTLTTVPGGWGSTAETPRRLIPTAGSLQASDGTNFDDWRQIHYEHEVYIFGTSWATAINYNFRQGFVATLTPIFPEP